MNLRKIVLSQVRRLLCLKKEEYKKIIDISSEDDRISRHLKGETLEVDDLADKKAKGWHLVCVDGYPLGWGKDCRRYFEKKISSGMEALLMIRLDKYLADMGCGTRQEVKKLIQKRAGYL